MMLERMLYRIRNTMWQAGSHLTEMQSINSTYSKHTLMIKLVIHYTLVLIVHSVIVFLWPLRTGMTMSQNLSIVFFYINWLVYFIYSGLQIKYGYPQTPYKQTFTDDTSVVKVNLFRLY